MLIVNTTKSAKEIRDIVKFAGRIAIVDATGIAWKELGVPITNTTMLGALVGVTKVVKFDSLKGCLLYTSDAADDLLCVDLGGRRIIKKKKYQRS